MLEFLVSGRYHNPILAAIMGCPSITLASTSHKVHGTCEMLEGLIGTPFDGTDIRSCLDAIEATGMTTSSRVRRFGSSCKRFAIVAAPSAYELGDIVAERSSSGRADRS